MVVLEKLENPNIKSSKYSPNKNIKKLCILPSISKRENLLSVVNKDGCIPIQYIPC